ncbi:unnamed protein product [Lota lota]
MVMCECIRYECARNCTALAGHGYASSTSVQSVARVFCTSTVWRSLPLHNVCTTKRPDAVTQYLLCAVPAARRQLRSFDVLASEGRHVWVFGQGARLGARVGVRDPMDGIGRAPPPYLMVIGPSLWAQEVTVWFPQPHPCSIKHVSPGQVKKNLFSSLLVQDGERQTSPVQPSLLTPSVTPLPALPPNRIRNRPTDGLQGRSPWSNHLDATT